MALKKSELYSSLWSSCDELRGGISSGDIDAPQRYWTVCRQLRRTLFNNNRPGYVDLAVRKTAIKSTIYKHPQFVAFIGRMNTLFPKSRKKRAATLKDLEAGCHPKEVIAALKKELKPQVMRVVFKDSGFADDVVKTNAVQILKQAGIEDVKSL